MTSQQDSKTKRAALDKAQEGARLLRTGVYQGAIAACTEAIRLDPRFDDAYLLRSEAYRRRDRPSPLRFIFSPLVFIGEILVSILRFLWWLTYDHADAMDRAHGLQDSRPPPRFREHLEEQNERRKLAQERVEALLATPRQLDQREAPKRTPMSLGDRETSMVPILEEGPSNEERIEAECAAFRNLGVDARVLERDPVSLDSAGTWRDAIGWIEIDGGPIRWVTLAYNWGYSEKREPFCFVPDPRIEPGFPDIIIEPVPVTFFPLFGRVKGVRWKTCGFYYNVAKEFTRSVANSLSHNTALTQKVLSVRPAQPHVETFPDRRCWTISEFDTGKTTKWTRPLWDCYQAIAEALLAMPMPAER